MSPSLNRAFSILYPSRSKWSREEVWSLLLSLHFNKVDKIAEQMGKTPREVVLRAVRMNLMRRVLRVRPFSTSWRNEFRPWSPDELEWLSRSACRFSAWTLSRILGRTEAQIAYVIKVKDISLVNRRSDKVHISDVLPPELIQEEVAKVFSVKPIACLAGAALFMVALASCSYSKYEEPERPMSEALAEAEAGIDALFTEGFEYGTPMRVSQAREESCLDTVRDENWNRVSRIYASGGGEFPDEASSQNAMNVMKSYADSAGWTKVREERPTDTEDTSYRHTVVYEKDNLTFVGSWEYVESSVSDPYQWVDFHFSTTCLKQEEGHILARSKFDRDYGITSQYYDADAERRNPATFSEIKVSTPVGKEPHSPRTVANNY